MVTTSVVDGVGFEVAISDDRTTLIITSKQGDEIIVSGNPSGYGLTAECDGAVEIS